MPSHATSLIDAESLRNDGFYLIRSAIDETLAQQLSLACQTAFESMNRGVLATSAGGQVYAARNLLEAVPLLKTFWQTGPLSDTLQTVLGAQLGLVRVLYFDKPPNRTWSLPWHKDLAIAVKDHSGILQSCSRPTIKAGVPHVIACDEVLQRMLTLRIHLDEVTDENGPLQVIAGSHLNSRCEGVGAERATTIYAAVGDVLAMRPLLSHCSGSSLAGTSRHRRILHLEFATHDSLPDGLQWHDYIPLKPQD